MAFLLENAYNGSALVADAANHPNIRLFTSKKTSSKVPLLEQPVRKPPLWSHFILKMIILPRQARDKDRKSRGKAGFFAGGRGAVGSELPGRCHGRQVSKVQVRKRIFCAILY
jgi:hypothetical protein